jgi:ABC-type glycerol-3-phosphate transport system permease component
MFSKLNELLQKLSHPHPVIEYILAGVVLLSTAVSFLSDNTSGGRSAFSQLVADYPLLSTIFAAMSLVALIHLAFLSVYPPTRLSFKWRSRALRLYTLGFMFVAVLGATTVGLDNLLWVNEFAISLIAAVLHLNLKVNYTNAGE